MDDADVQLFAQLVEKAIALHKSSNFYVSLDIITNGITKRFSKAQLKEYAQTVAVILRHLQIRVNEQDLILVGMNFLELKDLFEQEVQPAKFMMSELNIQNTNAEDLVNGARDITVMTLTEASSLQTCMDSIGIAKAYKDARDLLEGISVHTLEKKCGCEGKIERKVLIDKIFDSHFLPEVIRQAEWCRKKIITSDSAGVISLSSRLEFSNIHIIDKFMLYMAVAVAHLDTFAPGKFQESLQKAIHELTGQDGFTVVNDIMWNRDVPFDMAKLFEKTEKHFKKLLSRTEKREFESKLDLRIKSLKKELEITVGANR